MMPDKLRQMPNGMGLTRKSKSVWLTAFAAVLLFLPGITPQVSAQASPNWAVTNVYNCWVGWNTNFLYSIQYPNGNVADWFSNSTNGSATFGHVPGLWQEANMLQEVEDAFWYGCSNYQTFHPQVYLS